MLCDVVCRYTLKERDGQKIPARGPRDRVAPGRETTEDKNAERLLHLSLSLSRARARALWLRLSLSLWLWLSLCLSPSLSLSLSARLRASKGDTWHLKHR